MLTDEGIEITFLGTATSVGVPMIGCNCGTCRSDDPRDKRLRSSVYMRTQEAAWIVDTGPDFRTQCLRAGITRLDAVLLTHAHTDHMMGFDDVRRFTVPQDAFIDVYGNEPTLAHLQRVFEFAFNGQNRYPGYLKPEPRVVHEPFVLGKTRITPLPVQHGKVETIGYLFERAGRKLAAYLPDMKSPLGETISLLQEVEVLIVDALRHTPHPTHFTIEEALAFSREVKAQRTWFTHFQCEIRHADVEPTLPSEVRLAYDGLTLTLPLL